MIKNIEDETLQNIEIHIEEQDIIIINLLGVCKELINQGYDWERTDETRKALQQAQQVIKETEGR